MTNPEVSTDLSIPLDFRSDTTMKPDSVRRVYESVRELRDILAEGPGNHERALALATRLTTAFDSVIVWGGVASLNAETLSPIERETSSASADLGTPLEFGADVSMKPDSVRRVYDSVRELQDLLTEGSHSYERALALATRLTTAFDSVIVWEGVASLDVETLRPIEQETRPLRKEK